MSNNTLLKRNVSTDYKSGRFPSIDNVTPNSLHRTTKSQRKIIQGKKIFQEEKDKLKKNMMIILERYNLITKQQLEQNTLSTGELLKKIHKVLVPNKFNWLFFLNHEYNTTTKNFLERLNNIDLEVEGKKKKGDRKFKLVQRGRLMSTKLCEKKYKDISADNNSFISLHNRHYMRRASEILVATKGMQSKIVYTSGIKDTHNMLGEKLNLANDNAKNFSLKLHEMPLITDKEPENKELGDIMIKNNANDKKKLAKRLSSNLIEKLKVKEEPVKEAESKS